MPFCRYELGLFENEEPYFVRYIKNISDILKLIDALTIQIM